MWQGQIFMGLMGLCGGAVVATALAAFIIELGIIPRYAGITHTAKHILLYEDCLMLGAVVGNLVSVYGFSIPLGRLGLGIVGIGFGMLLDYCPWRSSECFCSYGKAHWIKKRNRACDSGYCHWKNPWMSFAVFLPGIKIRKCLILIP